MSDSLPLAVAIAEDVLCQEIDDEVVLLKIQSQQYYGLNEVGAQMWKSLVDSGNVTAAEDSLAKMYEIEEPVLRADLQRLLRDLLDAGLLRAA
jgi:hypothetical protein